uniref:SCP domain-containing protein n=1 Tax=Mesocestoides corti TaxID=53468 RepID=A0A5K3F0X2_MESCO
MIMSIDRSRIFLKVMWASSTKVGCAKKFCREQNRGIVTCAFNNAGMQLRPRGRPYESGQSCSKCPSNYTCVHKQCSAMSTQQMYTDATA